MADPAPARAGGGEPSGLSSWTVDARPATPGDPAARLADRGARAQGRAARRGAPRGRDRPHGRAQLPPRAAGRRARSHARRRAVRVGARRRARPGRGRRHVHAAHRRAAGPAARAGHREPDRRLAADPQPRDRGREPRDGLAGRRRPAAALHLRRRRRGRLGARHAPDPGRRVRHRAQADVPGGGRADRRLRPRRRRRPAAVREGRHAQRDGDRRLLRQPLAVAARAPRGGLRRLGRPDAAARRRGRGVHRRGAGRGGPLGARRTAPGRAGRALRRARRRGRAADRRRARHGGLSAPRGRRARAAHARAGPGRRAHGPEADRQRRRARDRGRLGRREPALRAARAARAPGREERVRAGRVRLVLGLSRRDAGVLLPRPRRPGRRARGDDGRRPRRSTVELHAIQQAFVDAGAVQCGFCTPGLVVASHDLLRRDPQPGEAEIREALAGNLCRCTGYAKIIDAVQLAAERMAAAP